MHKRSLLSPFILAVLADVFHELVREGMISELMYADDLALINRTTKDDRNKVTKWKEAFESEGLKVNSGKTKVMVCSSATNDGLSKLDE